MSDRAKYSRVYWSIRSDPKFVDVWWDDQLLATWLRLLITAESLWPEPADVPGRTRLKPYRRLVDLGIVDDLGNGMYRIHGLDSERYRRGEASRIANRVRWESERSPNGVRTESDGETGRSPRQDEHRQDEYTRARLRDGLHHVTARIEGAWERASGRHILGSGAFAQEYLDDACSRHPEDKVLEAIARASAGWDHTPSTQQLAAAVRAILDPLPSSKVVQSADAERRAKEASDKRVAGTLARLHFQHGEPRDGCPLCDTGDAA